MCAIDVNAEWGNVCVCICVMLVMVVVLMFVHGGTLSLFPLRVLPRRWSKFLSDCLSELWLQQEWERKGRRQAKVTTEDGVAGGTHQQNKWWRWRKRCCCCWEEDAATTTSATASTWRSTKVSEDTSCPDTARQLCSFGVFAVCWCDFDVMLKCSLLC